jgi:hypothetical protein
MNLLIELRHHQRVSRAGGSPSRCWRLGTVVPAGAPRPPEFSAGSPADRIPNALITGVGMSYGEGAGRQCCPY